jgi:hypothetical protein
MRYRLSLDGLWDFVTDSGGNLRIDKLNETLNWRKIRVPSFWEAQFEDLINYDGIAWYRRDVSLPKEWLEMAGDGWRLFIHFEAVDYYACVFVGEKMVGEHEGGYLPFEFELTDELQLVKQSGQMTITVQVIDPTDDRLRFPRFPADEIPCGKQRWYLNVGGIWQSVWLELRRSTFIEEMFVTPMRDLEHIILKLKLSNPASERMRCDVTVEEADGRVRAHADAEVDVGQSELELKLRIEDAKPWHPESPNIYLAKASLSNGDEFSTTFGMRVVECNGGKVCINGEPIYIIGALDQDFYHDEIYRAPSDDFLERQFRLAKEIGFNTLRCHLKLPERRYLDIADRVGMLVWYELPSWSRFGERLRQRVKRHIREMVKRDYNHPSLIAYGIVGEGWGLKLNEQELHRRWLVETVEFLRSLDGTRLIVDNSPCLGNFHIKTDINDFHIYCNSPDEDEKFRRWLWEFDKRPYWTFSTHGDAQAKGDEPLIVSEFGIWGLPKKAVEIAKGDEKPWWWKTGSGACCPEGLNERFLSSYAKDAFDGLDEVCTATRTHQAEALIYQIEQIRKCKNIVGYVVTQLTDVAWECNGILDFERHEKEVAKALQDVQAQDMLIATLSNECVFGGATVFLEATLSHYSHLKVEDGSLRLKLCDEHGNVLCENEFGDITVEHGKVSKVAECELLISDFKEPTWLKAELQLTCGEQTIASTRKRFLALPSSWRSFDTLGCISIYDPQCFFNGIKEELQGLGAHVATDLDYGDIILSAVIDEKLINAVAGGRRAICIVEMAHAMQAYIEGISIVDRSFKGRWGSWCTSFTWLSPTLRESLKLPPILPHAMRDVVPRCVIEVDGEKIGHVLEVEVERADAGMFVGWLHNEALVALTMRINAGKLLLTTFRVASELSEKPARIALLRVLLQMLMKR